MMNDPTVDDAIDVVLFDLDGTLLDTAADMAGALNTVLARHDRAPLPVEVVRPHVSKGGMALICLGFDTDRDDPTAAAIYEELLEAYRRNMSTHTRLFPGMESLLARIESDGRRYGVVTNKPAFLTEPLLDEMRLATRVACVVSGDTLKRKKPWPDPLLHACAMVGTPAARAVYIGDDARDIEAGRRAGMRTIAAAYGYIVPGDDPRAWGADFIVNHPDEIQAWLAREFVREPSGDS